eukprot:1161572-Pelagomonas_calceolata.AAC.3
MQKSRLSTPSFWVLVGPATLSSSTPLTSSNTWGLDHQRANKLARKLNAPSVMYANKLVTTRHANS